MVVRVKLSDPPAAPRTVNLRVVTVSVLAAGLLSGCTDVVSGAANRAQSHPVVPARTLLLAEGTRTPAGPASQIPVGTSYFTAAQPQECTAATLFLGSPLVPPGAADHAETGYRTSGGVMMAETVSTYEEDLDIPTVVRDGSSAVSSCTTNAVGISPTGPSRAMRLDAVTTPADGVLTWTMTRPGWNCDYGLAVTARAALVLSVCDYQPGFQMGDWAKQRRDQLMKQNV
ncbi:hypothetical protein BST13_25670 [Mycobacterium aquaticum]|uniref:PknH-like extracellular domain-containing protein n=1 Tax=Mycobacterium aquaticum TaxID=1927124 RepID=A0A1X0AML0_9MYCO|nr:hypothetical protein BST13_25670 [Mycobacterium aquaticum]